MTRTVPFTIEFFLSYIALTEMSTSIRNEGNLTRESAMNYFDSLGMKARKSIEVPAIPRRISLEMTF